MGYGYAARDQYGKQHESWSDDLEIALKSEWETGKAKTRRTWEEVRSAVRRGFEAKH